MWYNLSGLGCHEEDWDLIVIEPIPEVVVHGAFRVGQVVGDGEEQNHQVLGVTLVHGLPQLLEETQSWRGFQ